MDISHRRELIAAYRRVTKVLLVSLCVSSQSTTQQSGLVSIQNHLKLRLYSAVSIQIHLKLNSVCTVPAMLMHR